MMHRSYHLVLFILRNIIKKRQSEKARAVSGSIAVLACKRTNLAAIGTAVERCIMKSCFYPMIHQVFHQASPDSFIADFDQEIMAVMSAVCRYLQKFYKLFLLQC